ncbi:MAG: DHA1 family bicyclomycin/chloramphenicol resistance-like MFS transporter [Parasphingorhabdus sp.]|jgi:DHA1 family bicyclomycin/chloramphenicol resistance-like MFS transporter
MTITQPAASAIMQEFNTDFGIAQLVITFYLISSAISALVLGSLSDKFGRRRVMFWGLSLFLIGGLISLYSSNLEWLLAGRFIQGAGGAVGITLTRASVRDVYGMNKSASIIAYITMAMVVAPMIGPILGGYLTELSNWRYIFLLLSIYTAILLVFTFFNYHETLADNGVTSQSRYLDGLVLLRYREFWGHLINLAFSSGMFFVFIAGAPFVAIELLGITPSEYGLYFVFCALGYMFGNFLTGRLAVNWGPQKVMRHSLIPLVTGVVGLWFFSATQHPLALFFPFMFITMANGLTIPNATAASLSIRPDLAGSASGILGFTQVGVGAIFSVVSGFAQDGTIFPLLWLLSLCSVFSVIGLWLANSQSQPGGESTLLK